MKRVKIPKGNGKFRNIFIPSPKEAAALRELLPFLSKLERDRARHFEVSHVAHGFIAGRSPVTCAMRHVGYQITCNYDLESWFDSVSVQQLLAAGVPQDIAEKITVDGFLRQGLPTSPVAANLAAVELDKRLIDQVTRRITRSDHEFSYTRYADDIIISGKTHLPTPGLEDNVKYEVWSSLLGMAVDNAVAAVGWKIAEHKTQIQTAKAGRRIIVGISVGPEDIQATRKTKRRLRAAKHQKNEKQIKGLSEWVACKMPRSARGLRRIAGITPGSTPEVTTTPASTSANVVMGGTRRLNLE